MKVVEKLGNLARFGSCQERRLAPPVISILEVSGATIYSAN